MVSGLTCAPKSTVKAADYGDLFSFLCPGASCDGINGNGTTGVYGAFSMCNSVDRLAWAMNSVCANVTRSPHVY